MRHIYIIICIALLSNSYAIEAFNRASFNDDISQGRPVIIQVATPWCGHCMIQSSALSTFQNQQPYDSYAFYKLPKSGSDDEKNYLNENYIQPYLKQQQSQDNNSVCDLNTRSTLIVISDNKIVQCSAFETNKDKIEDMLKAI